MMTLVLMTAILFAAIAIGTAGAFAAVALATNFNAVKRDVTALKPLFSYEARMLYAGIAMTILTLIPVLA